MRRQLLGTCEKPIVASQLGWNQEQSPNRSDTWSAIETSTLGNFCGF